MASFKAKFPVLQELFAKNHRGGPFGPPQRGEGYLANTFVAKKLKYKVLMLYGYHMKLVF